MTPAISMTWPDYLARRVRIDGIPVRLRPLALEFVSVLLMRRGSVVSQADLIEAMWPNPYREPDYALNIVRGMVNDVRGAIGRQFVETYHGRGYRIPLDHELTGAAA